MLRTKRILIGWPRRTAVIPLLLTTSVMTAQQRTPPPISPGTSAIRGQVVDAITREGVPGCTVQAITGPEFRHAERTTNDNGAYEFTNIAAANYMVTLDCSRHQSSSCEAVDGGTNLCSNINLVADQQRSDVNFRVTPGATARGRVISADGTPIARASVSLGPRRSIGGGFMMRAAVTDANGAFELVNLPAGEWRLEVIAPRPPGGPRLPIVYYPGGLTWDEAIGIELEAGKVTGNLTVVVPKIVENTMTVRMSPPNKTVTQLAVSVLRAAPLTVLRLDLDQKGIATVKGMLPGRYVVAARGASKKEQWAAFKVVDFVENSVDVSLNLLRTGSIAGRVVAEKGRLPPLDGVSVGASWVHEGAAVSPLDPDLISVARNGSFRISGVFGTRKLQLTGLDPQWVIRAIRQKRKDVTVSGVDIVPGRTIEATIVVAPQ